ncbi:MAG: HisA/HisF-related TIM barrel protein [Actinomycetota bacterium]|nr:HisA/HisF-related TIM barrel protein [Actinomycetota bacterium]
MHLIPAIDLLNGTFVRLRKGDYQDVTDYGDPMEWAMKFVSQGASHLHIVDLDAARQMGDNNEVISRLIGELSRYKVRIDVGGGIRSIERAKQLQDLGVDRIVVGSKAISSEDFARSLASALPEKVWIGLDYRRVEGKILCAIEGWTMDSDLTLEVALERFVTDGVAGFVLTDISRDGMLAGPDIDTLSLAGKIISGRCELIASGGVSRLEDLDLLAAEVGAKALYGVISGRAIAEGRLDLAEGSRRCAAYE